MGSANPVTTVVESSGTLLQRFYVNKQHLAMDVIAVKGTAPVAQTSFDPAEGAVTNPSSLAAVKRFGMTLVYGVLNVSTVEGEKPVVKQYLAQLSPTVAPIAVESKLIQLGDNFSVAATSDEKDQGWLYAVEKNQGAVRIVEYAFDYTNTADPTKTTFGMSDVLAISRLAVAAIPQTSLEFKRALVYQTTAKSLSLRQWPGSQNDVVTEDDVMEQTPIAVVVKTVAGTQMIYVYFVSGSNRRLMRARKALLSGSWEKKAVLENDSVSESSDLAATAVQGGVVLSFILTGNQLYRKVFDNVDAL